MELTPYEKETILLFNEGEDTASVYTHNTRLIKKLKKLSEKYPDKIYEEKSGNIQLLTPFFCHLQNYRSTV